MTDALRAAAARLKSEGFTCVLRGDGMETASKERGVLPLVKLLDGGGCYFGWSAADKVVGRAAAMLYLRLGVKEVYASVISEGAADTLRRGGVRVYADETVRTIVNRRGDGICPMEECVAGVSSPAEAEKLIRNKLKHMGLYG